MKIINLILAIGFRFVTTLIFVIVVIDHVFFNGTPTIAQVFYMAGAYFMSRNFANN